MTEFNPHTCAALHNKIIAHTAATPQEPWGNRVVHNCFTAYGEEAVELRTGLPQPLIDFLEQIDVFIPVYKGCESAAITPHLRIAEPSELLGALFGDFRDGESDIFYDTATLYVAAIGECDDLYFDMDTNLCTLHQQGMPLPRNWYSLERALTLWLSLLETGKFHLENIFFNDSPRIKTTDDDLARNFRAYDSLLAAICERNPELSVGEPGLIAEDVLDRFHITGFMRSFCLRARKPNFSFIAPGLQTPATEWLAKQLQADVGSERYEAVREQGLRLHDEDLNDPDIPDDLVGEPLPLFHGPPITLHLGNPDDDWIRFVVGGVSGLYSWPDRWFGDGTMVILPYPIGSNGYVKEGNPGWIRKGCGQDVPDHMVDHEKLLRHGVCPFLSDHPPRLFTVLKKFESLIRSGQWTVGADGVEDSIEKWKKADTSTHAEKYRLGACFDE